MFINIVWPPLRHCPYLFVHVGVDEKAVERQLWGREMTLVDGNDPELLDEAAVRWVWPGYQTRARCV